MKEVYSASISYDKIVEFHSEREGYWIINQQRSKRELNEQIESNTVAYCGIE